MGLLDFPAPALDAIDGLLAVALPVWLRLILWASLGGVATMWLYGRLSNQQQIHAIRQELRAEQRLLQRFDGELSELKALVGKNLALAMRWFGLSLWPAVVSSLPVMLLLVWMSYEFAWQAPVIGDTVRAAPLSPVSAEPALRFSGADSQWIEACGCWQLTIETDAETSGLTTPPVPIASRIEKRRWWHTIIGNRAGYIESSTAVDGVSFDWQPKQYLPFGPPWLRGWLATFLLVTVITSLLAKRAFRLA